jgi:hypothetical protein
VKRKFDATFVVDTRSFSPRWLLLIPYVGDLYYALTHSPAPLTKEDAYALSWQAATERLEAAGSIPVKEAEMMTKALSSNDAGIEVKIRRLTAILILKVVSSHCFRV